jgi:Xaa-Pro dipeptidase
MVLEAETHAVAAAREGARVGDVDRAARFQLERSGLGKYFIHRTGHGLGLEVHEAPYIVEGGGERLRDNMFFTVEPGVYIPGKLGVRIEDDVRVVGGKAVEISYPPKEYGWWK